MSNVRMTIRIPKELHESLLASAKQNRRSMNAEVATAAEVYLESGTNQAALDTLRYQIWWNFVAQSAPITPDSLDVHDMVSLIRDVGLDYINRNKRGYTTIPD